MRLLRLCLLLLTPVLMFAADAKPKAVSAGVSAEEDKRIEATIHAKLAKSKIGKNGFTVRVQGGTAYWEGVTSVPQHKGAATRMAKSSGARKVVNGIRVTDAGRQKAEQNLKSPAEPRRAEVKRP